MDRIGVGVDAERRHAEGLAQRDAGFVVPSFGDELRHLAIERPTPAGQLGADALGSQLGARLGEEVEQVEQAVVEQIVEARPQPRGERSRHAQGPGARDR